MKAPDIPSPTDIDILVADIVKKLGGGDMVEQDIRNTIAALGAIKSPLWGNRTENLKYMEKVYASVKKLQAALRAMPTETTWFMMFAPEDGETLDAMMQEAAKRRSELIMALEHLCTRCDKNIAAAPGVDGHFGYRERQAAIETRLLLERYGKPARITDKGPYLVIAGLLFQAAWGENPKDMKRACTAALASPIKTE